MELSECKSKLDESAVREKCLLEMVTSMENDKIVDPNNRKCAKDEFYIVGSSILREVRDTDVINGRVKSISGGKIDDVKANIQSIKYQPRNIITQIGGNDLDEVNSTVENVTSKYELLLTETKKKFPERTPRFHNDIIHTKVKDFNEKMRNWSEQNKIKFVDNKAIFEYRNGDIDKDSYIMSGDMPALHLKRKATVKVLENLKKSIPQLLLSDSIHESLSEKPSQTYAAVASQQVNRPWKGKTDVTF